MNPSDTKDATDESGVIDIVVAEKSPLLQGGLQALFDYLIAKGWTPAIEHVEPARSAEDYWYLWKLPIFGEKSVDRVLAEVEACRDAWPGHLVRLIGYDNYAQSQGSSVVVHRSGG